MQCSPFFSNFGTPILITNKTNVRTKRFTLNFHKIPAFVEFPAPGQLSEVKSEPPGNLFELIPGGCPGRGGANVPSWN